MTMGFGSYATRVVATKVVALDGTGDFTDIQSAIDALPAGGGVVYVKEGTYPLTTTININKNNVALVGAGKSTKITTDGNYPAILADNKSGIRIEKLFIYGTGTGNQNAGIKLNIVNYSMIHGCWVENCASGGILLITSPWNMISSTTCYNNGLFGIQLWSFAINNTVVNCVCNNNSGSGIYVTGTISGSTLLSNITSYNNVYGIYVSSSKECDIVGNTVIKNTRHGIYVWGSNRLVISGNVVHYNDYNKTASYDGIHLTNASLRNVINNNTCGDNDRYGINILTGCNYNVVVGNVLSGNGTGGFNDSGLNTEVGHNQTL